MSPLDVLLPALGGAVLHATWIGALVALLVALGMRALAREDADGRHGLALAGLALLVLTFLGDVARGLVAGSPPAASTDHLERLPLTELVERLLSGAALAPVPHGPDLRTLLAWGWLLGLVAMSLRLGRGQLWAHRLRRASLPLSDGELERRLVRLAHALGLERVPRLRVSPLVEGPAVVGWVRPVLLLPLCALSGLAPDQLSAVLAHELAHLRRRDHRVSALLALAEVLLFFHPAAWWLAGTVRREREHCCDRDAVRVLGDARPLARALANLETLRLPHPHAALAARDGDGPLLRRITRILNPTAMKPETTRPGRLRAALILAGLLVGGAWTRSAVANAADPTLTVAGDPEQDLQVVRERLKAAVASGHLEQAEAERVLRALKRSMQPEPAARAGEQELHDRYAAAKRKLAEAVRAGSLGEQDAAAKLEAYASELKADAARRSAEERAAVREVELRDRRAAVERKLAEAVRAGQLSKQEARAKLEAHARDLKDEVADAERAARTRRNDAERAHLDALRQRAVESLDRTEAQRARVEAAVRDGRLSKEEARARMERDTAQPFRVRDVERPDAGERLRDVEAPDRTRSWQEARRRYEEAARALDRAARDLDAATTEQDVRENRVFRWRDGEDTQPEPAQERESELSRRRAVEEQRQAEATLRAMDAKLAAEADRTRDMRERAETLRRQEEEHAAAANERLARRKVDLQALVASGLLTRAEAEAYLESLDRQAPDRLRQ